MQERVEDDEADGADEIMGRRVTARFPESLVRSMSRLARRHDRSLSAEIVRAVREYVQREESRAS